MKLVSEHSVRVDGCGHAGIIQNVFNDFICSEVERIDGDELWTCLSFIVMQEGGAMHGAKWMSVGNDRMVEMFPYTLYIPIFCLVSLGDQDSDLPALELSPTLVLVFTRLTVASLVRQPTIAILSYAQPLMA